MRKAGVLAVLLLTACVAVEQQPITASEAQNHVGRTATVCGQVASTHFAASTRGRPTFINLDKPYPNQIFTGVIWGSDRSKFGNPEQSYKDKRICVSGRITIYRGTPETVISEPSQVQVQQ